MISNQPLAIEPGGFEDLPKLAELWNTCWPDLYIGLSELERDWKVLPPENRSIFWLAKVDATVVGFAECHRDIGSYHPQKWTAYVGVHPEARHKRVGATLYDVAITFIEEQNAISATSRVKDTDQESLEFGLKRGFEEVKRDFESVLHLDKLDPSVLKEHETDQAEIRSAAEMDSPEFRREWHELFEIVRQDTPRSEPPTRMSFEKFEEIVLNDSEFSMEASHVALVDGRLVGFSGLYTTDEEGQLFQWLTAVHREFRGRKIAQAMKARGAKWAIENGYKKIRTDNDTRNGPMLAINDKLGFERLTGMVTIKKQFGEQQP